MYKFALLLLVIFSFPSFAATKCKLEWDALKNVQSQLRHNSTEWLRDKERRNHKAYQDCRKGKKKRKTKNKSYIANSSQNYTQYNKPLPNYRPYGSTINKLKIKGLFTGDKQQAWLDYYRPPKECLSPKSTQQFSKCLKFRDNEANKFRKVWDEQQAPPSINLGNN